MPTLARSSFTATVCVLLSAGGAAAQSWTVSPEPVLRIGVIDGDPSLQFNYVTDARRLSDGRILVVNDLELRLFDRDGRYLRTMGREGDGPGEFRLPPSVVIGAGDSIHAWDARPFRLTTFDNAGELASMRTHERPQPTEGYFTDSARLLPDRSILLSMMAVSPPTDPLTWGLFRSAHRIGRFDPASNTLVLLGPYGGARQQNFDLGSRTYPIPQPFSPHYSFTFGADRIFVAHGDSLHVDAFDFSGRPVTRYVVSVTPARVTQEDLSQARRQALDVHGALMDPQTRVAFERAWESIAKPAVRPVVYGLIADRVGFLWVQITGGNDPARYLVFDTGGREVGQVVAPAGFRLFEIGADYLLGLTYDDFGVSYVVLHDLVRR